MIRSRVMIATLAIDRGAARLLDSLTLSALPNQYHERLRNMASESARQQTTAGLWLLKQLLAAAGEPLETLGRLGVSGNGRPKLAHGPSFNISHSRAMVACVLSHDRTVGLDIEARTQRVPPRLVRETSEDEQAAVAAVPTSFFDFWCAREATIKASGHVGLGRLKRVRLSPGCAHVDGEHWHLLPLTLASDYAACLASSAPVGSTDIAVEHLSLFKPENTGRQTPWDR